MSIADRLTEAFPEADVSAMDDAFIRAKLNIMELPAPVDLLRVVPLYMLWCVRHPDDPALVSDFTLRALAEYGRCQQPGLEHLNFRYRCSQRQIDAVSAFLAWAAEALPFRDDVQLERARRRWTTSS
ncbi:hypothetical protein ATSB10_28210 [Dyella thiooxydans]|uniref:Uncharacterized protein n=1 Tax=Dyella thiooxydans TaxID=445710 RepID=A0A169GW44_9GAMM|nr:hypothetical protein [Dyella thiooxydans]AND70275.1 hypothetical protein ATSB10_28210 [Dyella thiooxydans]